jgi:vacuolar-type H+-ATPase subunit E/Vma4
MLAMVDDEVQADVDPKAAKAEARRLARAEAKAEAERVAEEQAREEKIRLRAAAKAEKAKALAESRVEAVSDMLAAIKRLLRSEKISIKATYELLERVVTVPEEKTRALHEVEMVSFVQGIEYALQQDHEEGF